MWQITWKDGEDEKEILKAQLMYYVCYMPPAVSVMSESFWIIKVFFQKHTLINQALLPHSLQSTARLFIAPIIQSISQTGDDRSEMTDFNHHWQPEE